MNIAKKYITKKYNELFIGDPIDYRKVLTLCREEVTYLDHLIGYIVEVSPAVMQIGDHKIYVPTHVALQARLKFKKRR